MTSWKHILAPAAFLAVLLAGDLVWAGPPFITDDPEPVEFKHWEVYLFSTFNHSAGVDSGAFPAVEVNYGVVPEVQLHLVTPGFYDRESGSPAHYGYGDTELGIKYRFIHETDWIPQVGTFPLVELPTGAASRGLGNGYTQVFVPIWLQKSFGADKKWTSFAGGGFWYNPGDAHRNYWRMGWELQRDLTEHLTLGGEIFHETPSVGAAPPAPGVVVQPRGPTVVGQRGHTAFNLGGYFNFDEHRHVLFSAGRDIDGPNRFSCYLAFQLTF